MSAPGLDLQIVELMDLPKNIFRTSINFMGCYAAIHAMKMANFICQADPKARVLVVCTELCTLHFQREATMDNIASSLIFADGSAAALITANEFPAKGIYLSDFYSEIMPKGKKDMGWELSSTGFIMTLSNYVPDLIEEDFEALVNRALSKKNLEQEDIAYWCIHPGGKKILESIYRACIFRIAI
jgi:predicted naringenin-chalcone synthase